MGIILNKIKAQATSIINEAKEDLNNPKVVNFNAEQTLINKEVALDKNVKVKSLKPNIKSFKAKSKNIDMLGNIKEETNHLPCNKCKINDLCKKAYSLNMPKYDTTMFDLDISCSRIILENNMEEGLDMTKEECLEEVKYTSELPCKECSIADICSKAHSLKLPDTKEVFTIGVSCKRFINK